MKKLILLAALTVSLAASDFENTYRPTGKLNGRWWVEMDERAKLSYVEGYADAVLMVPNWRENRWFPTLPIDFGDLIKGVDRIYEEPDNLILPISDAIWIFTLKTKGESPERVQEAFRISFSKLKPQLPTPAGPWKVKQQ